ncbi:DUF4225 domain-containing protein [Atlantibacter sp.]|uniref:DUF4225 domain-containing protein n=1 Tax=Atlantibacter sp. TaxID=1903473 RepID=UPI0028ACAEAF|nr:DUF4225 domain-containing protein [Atlantibacter sp.]
MDSALLDRMRSGRDKNWAETMVNLEARELINTANMLSTVHFREGMTRIKFVQEIKAVVERQFAAARSAKSDEECMACVNILRAERKSLQDQDRMLRSKAAKLYAQVEFVRENNKIVGYVISAVHVVVSGMAIAGGIMMITTMTPLGVLAGATLVLDGFNGLTKEIIPRLYEERQGTEGIVADGVIETAKFMGFKAESGLAFYNGLTLTASIYSIWGLTRKPEAWRLYNWLPSDYYRKINTISRPKLTMKIIGYGVKAKVIFDLLNVDN